jgi:hypothetical protein
MLQRIFSGLGLGGAQATFAALELLIQEKNARLLEKDAFVGARLLEKDARLQEKDARLLEKDARLLEKDEAMRRMEATFAKDLAAAQYATDIAESRMGSRALLEGALDVIWGKLGTRAPDSTTQKLAVLLKEGGPCPGLLAYLRQAAVDNGVKEAEVLRQSGKLFDVLGERIHAEPVGGVTSVPVDLFRHPGRTTLLAFAALAGFSGRDLSLYGLGVKVVPLKLRALRGDCTATQARLRTSALIVQQVGVREILE